MWLSSRSVVRHILAEIWEESEYVTLKIEAIYFCETSVPPTRVTRRHILEDNILYGCSCSSETSVNICLEGVAIGVMSRRITIVRPLMQIIIRGRGQGGASLTIDEPCEITRGYIVCRRTLRAGCSGDEGPPTRRRLPGLAD
jgi:hypothetical protein